MKVVTPAQMRALDAAAVAKAGIPSRELMERAGAAVAGVAAELALAPRAVVAAGPGNNGGDGLVAARLLRARGYDVTVFLPGAADAFGADARANYELFVQAGGAVVPFSRPRFARAVRDAGVVVDALLGTGSRGALEGDFKAAAAAVNGAAAPVVAADVPSGIDAATGAVAGVAVRADATVTFGLPKLGLTQFPARGCAGAVHVADIGFPAALVDGLPYDATGKKLGFVARIAEAAEVAALLPPRPLNLHKGAAGRAYILAGSRGMSGAAVLAAKSCLRAGAGLVVTGLPAELDVIFSVACLEGLSQQLPQSPEGWLVPAAAALVKKGLAAADAAAIGPGLGRAPATGELVAKVAAALRRPAVIDADGLNLLGLKGLAAVKAGGVLTPHPGEMARLFGVGVDDVESDRLKWARELARRTGKAVVLKGYMSIVAAPGEETWLNPTGNPGLASGGTGDVLTGVILALLAGGAKPAAAARAGAYVHGLAGDVAAEWAGERSLVAGDVMEALPAAFALLEKGPAEGDPGEGDVWTHER